MNSPRLSFLAGLGALLIYVLSPGPVAKYYMTTRKPPPLIVSAIYAPLGWAHEHIPGVRKAYELYFTAWGIN